jgi:outer membrane protein TolC
MLKKSLPMILLCLLLYIPTLAAEKAETHDSTLFLSLQDFIAQASDKDERFEAILLSGLSAEYQAKLNLPAAELLISVKGQYNLALREDDEGGVEGGLSLSKLFPGSGTQMDISYSLSESDVLNTPYSRFTAVVSQPIAENAFGYTHRLQEKIVGLEIELAQHQMVEAYEDYLAQLMKTYYTWYAALARVRTSEATFRENSKLLENVRARRRNRIANQTDVDKTHLQVLSKETTLITLRKALADLTLMIKQAIRTNADAKLEPVKPEALKPLADDFTKEYAVFAAESRTQRMLGLLEEKNGDEVKKYADQLLPSAELQAGYAAEGTEEAFDSRERQVYAGLAVEIPFMNKHEQWRYELAKTEQEKTKLLNLSIKEELRTDLEKLYLDIQATQKRLDIAKQQVAIASAVLRDENRYYLQGRSELNDLILAANNLEENRYLEIYLGMEHNILLIEWLRMTDRLIRRQDIVKDK